MQSLLPDTAEVCEITYWGKDNRLKCRAVVRRNGVNPVTGDPRVTIDVQEGRVDTPIEDIKNKQVRVIEERDYHKSVLMNL